MKNSVYFPSVKAPAHSLGVLQEKYDERLELKDATEAVHYLSTTPLEKDTSILIHLTPTDGEASSASIKRNGMLSLLHR